MQSSDKSNQFMTNKKDHLLHCLIFTKPSAIREVCSAFSENRCYKMYRNHLIAVFIACHFFCSADWCFAQDGIELNTGWKCMAAGKLTADPEKLSTAGFLTRDWMPATVPGTVLTTLLNNGLVPDPFSGMNNEKIPDIYTTGNGYYTYWFVKDFRQAIPARRDQVWLHFRGVNYGCEVWLNGHRLNQKTHYGMFLRQTYNITAVLSPTGNNRLAVLVYPPDPPGNPNGGQGGDGAIARNNTHQYVAGWDWIQPIPDRNTGIWDKVTIEKTGNVRIQNIHIITEANSSIQAPALLRVSAELVNTDMTAVSGELYFELEGEHETVEVNLPAGSTQLVKLPDHYLRRPRLWWPNGYGRQEMYHGTLSFGEEDETITTEGSKKLYRDSDAHQLDFGVREIRTSWNSVTRSREISVNGQKIFIKGGNWIVSDELLRLSPERYDAEIRFHRDMNLNLIRVWGGALTERPEFYQACDKYGLLVFQDFWNSGDCNGRWPDPKKKDDQATRRKYPDDHALFLASVADQVKMLRNHPSLAFWCGGNEITPPDDILSAMKDSILPELDGTRYFFDYSNTDSMSFNSLGGNGDGPYRLQPVERFWSQRSFPFNSEVGSVGLGDYESLSRFLPAANRMPPSFPGKLDSIWRYHKYIGYDSSVYAYGTVRDLKDFADKAQLVNYDQYRALAEGFSSHMWAWYTGFIIWKTQNPWTAMRGQMYDYYLDPNACLYGLHCGSEPLHVQYDPVGGMTMIVNNTFGYRRDLMLQIDVLDKEGHDSLLGKTVFEIGPASVKQLSGIRSDVDALRKKEGAFLYLRLLDEKKVTVSENLYWLPDSAGNYTGLEHMRKTRPKVRARWLGTRQVKNRRIAVTISDPAVDPIAFFNRVSLVNPKTKRRLLPVFYSDNYISVMPGRSKTIVLEYTAGPGAQPPLVSVRGWNVDEAYYPVSSQLPTQKSYQ
jgi:mannosylglycoprotein endo-beta-mannosidase